MGAVEFVSIALPAVFWPLVVGLFVLTQRKPIGRLVDRIRSARVFGQEIDAPPPDLAEAAQGGASSPEVEKVIRSASADWATLGANAFEVAEQRSSSDEKSLVGEVPQPAIGSADEPSTTPRTLYEAQDSLVTWLEKLTAAQRQDESRRRSEIERIMKSSARWGARMARNRPNEVDDWEPVIRWKDDGEPEIMAVRGPDSASRNNREMFELQAAEAEYNQAVIDYASAESAARAATALREASEPSAELQDRAREAKLREIVAREQMHKAEAIWVVKRRNFDRD